MDDQQLDLALAAMGRERMAVPDPPALHERAMAVPRTTRKRNGFLPGLTWRFKPMSSATKFLVAVAIVALFGGFLLTGILTRPSEDRPPAVGASASATTRPASTASTRPELTSESESDSPTSTTSTDLLPGVDLLTEEVEPGAHRVLSDGVRELESEATTHRVGDMDLIGMHHNIVAGLDGSVWLFGPDAFYRLGDQDQHGWPDEDDDLLPATDLIEIAPDGVIWRVSTLDLGPLMSFEQGAWTTQRDRAVGVAVQRDGTTWAAWLNDNDRLRAGRIDGDAWTTMPGNDRGVIPIAGAEPLAVAGDAGAGAWMASGDGVPKRVDEDGWHAEPLPRGSVYRLDVAPEGTVWALIRDSGGEPDSAILALARRSGGTWSVFYDIPQQIGMATFEGLLHAGADGSIWISPYSSLQTTVCEGVSNFDGVTLRRHLPDLCVYAMDVALDGSVWLLAGEWPEVSDPRRAGPIRTYVITPDAAAGTG